MKNLLIIVLLCASISYSQDSIETCSERVDCYIYARPSEDSINGKIGLFDRVVVIGSEGDFYKILQGYVKKPTVRSTDELKLFDRGIGRAERLRILQQATVRQDDEKRVAAEAEAKRKYEKAANLRRKFGKKQAEEILQEQISIGMSKEAVSESWGEPEHINRTVTRQVLYEQWVYPDGHTFLYFENGKLTTIQH